MLCIRVDANEIIGTGHVMRCLSIAEELRRQNELVIFIVADSRSEGMIMSKGFRVICLNSWWNDLDKELEKLISIIETLGTPALLIDSYYVTKDYLQQIGQYTKVIYMDDLDRFLYPVDLLINYNFYALQLNYEERYRRDGFFTKFILGSQYAPLRIEFQGKTKKYRKHISSIMITSGGTDSYNIIEHLLEGLYKQKWFADIQYDIILGRFNHHKEMLEKKWEHYGNVHFHVNVSNMSDYMSQCDIAITAGGSTIYELCACGVPSILYTLADNQFRIAKTVSEMGLMTWVGDIREDIQLCVKKMILEIEILKDDREKRKKQGQYMMDIVDAKGCSRIVEQIKLIKNSYEW